MELQTQTVTIFPSNETTMIGKIAQLKVCILNMILSTVSVLSKKVLPSRVLSENVNNLVHTVDNGLISIGALNT